MIDLDSQPKKLAYLLWQEHGPRAAQLVADHIVSSIREHDVASAKRWDLIGQEVDLLVGKAGNQKPADTGSASSGSLQI